MSRSIARPDNRSASAFSLETARRRTKRSPGSPDIKLGNDQRRDNYAEQYGCRGSCGPRRNGQGSLRSTLRLDGQPDQLFAVLQPLAELRAAGDRAARHLRLRELSQELVRAALHQHRQRADTILLQSAYLHLGATGVHGRGNTRGSRRVLRQQTGSRHVT